MINFLNYFLFVKLNFSIYNVCKMIKEILSMTTCLIVDDDSKILEYVSNYISREVLDVVMPVIMLTARDALSDKEQAYLTGTDDYVTKQFEVKELIFRIKAVLKRYNINANNELKVGNLTLNQAYLELQSSTKSMNLPN